MKTFVYFLCGAAVSFSVSLIIIKSSFPSKIRNNLPENVIKIGNQNTSTSNHFSYEETVSDELFKKVRLLCWIMTTPENHMTKAIHVKNTWGRRCNKLLFMSTEKDLTLDTVALPVKEGRRPLWDKTKTAFHYVYNHHFGDADWFLKADDDNYVIPENIRYMLYQYRPETPLYFGHRYAVEDMDEGYMAGGGYILSKAALKKFVTVIMPNKTICNQDEDGDEDLEIGKCLQHAALFADERDSLLQKRFFPIGISEHFNKNRDENYWYVRSEYYHVEDGSLKCCSDTPAGFHYVEPEEMYLLDYLIRNVHPFGIELNSTEELPKKLTLQEIIRASDLNSSATNYREHPFFHNLDISETYKRK